MRDVALEGSRHIKYGINSIEPAPGSSIPPLRAPGSQEHSGPDARASQGRAAAFGSASLDLSSTPDNADAGDDGGDGHGRKGKDRARESPPAGVVDVGGDERPAGS